MKAELCGTEIFYNIMGEQYAEIKQQEQDYG